MLTTDPVRCGRCAGTGQAHDPRRSEWLSVCDHCGGLGERPMRTGILIQARLGSTRFPRKALALLRGTPVIRHVYDRACRVQGVDVVRVIVPHEPEAVLPGGWDGALGAPVSWMAPSSIAVDDVLTRYWTAASIFDLDLIMRVTGDSPLWNATLGAQVLGAVRGAMRSPEEWWYGTTSGYPSGWDVEVLTRGALDVVYHRATTPTDREHVTPWLKRERQAPQIVIVASEGTPTDSLSLDTPAQWQHLQDRADVGAPI